MGSGRLSTHALKRFWRDGASIIRHMSKSPRIPFIISGVAAFITLCCWFLQLPPADTSQWSEKRWSVHRVNHATEGFCMLGFMLLAILCLAFALYRCLGSRGQRNDKPET